ncbi:hypothetical protein [Parasitella parasitica]|uniref:Uncharacterized protein n=1 Tax=Parasitella parasitica TaxID=35722 RepID=A0A0B7NQY3_9FUNG|nr:hypothetical protein [Parasitella parasitica]
MIHNRVTTSNASKNLLKSLGVNPSGFDRLFPLKLYSQVVRAQLEYGLAIIPFTYSQITDLESFQNQAICGIFGGSPHSSVSIMRHLAKMPSMNEHTTLLQARYLLLRSLNLPPDALLSCFFTYLNASVDSYYVKLCRNPI